MRNLIVCYDVTQRKLNEEEKIFDLLKETKNKTVLNEESVYYDIEKTLSNLGKVEHLQKSVFLVETEKTEQFVFCSVKETIGQADSKILVVDITGRELLK